MVVTELPEPITEWLAHGIPLGLAAFFVLSIAAILISYLVTAFRYGPGEAFYLTTKVVFTGVAELFQISPRRVLAIAGLSFKESVRHRVLVAFLVFIAILLFAGWFLDTKSTNPGRLYISFALTSTNYLILALALFLSAFSLPTDIKNRTIHTIMTKPVRAWEIVLGRIIGFCAIGTVLLATMGLFCWGFILRGLSHSHTIVAEQVKDSEVIAGGKEGFTSYDDNHKHRFKVDADGIGKTDRQQGHYHNVTRQGERETAVYVVGPPQDALLARVPQYGKELRFLDRTGKPASAISVGYEWTYRGYFEGGTLAAAIWEFEDITPERYPDGLDLEWTVSVFRTHKGDIETGVSGSWVLRNPDSSKNKESPPIIFESQEFSADSRHIPREWEVDSGKVVDLFEEYVDDQGRLELVLRCDDRAQYFGVARADAYLRAGNKAFAWNFAKGYLSVWLQMTLVVGMGVMFSTFLSAPVAMLATLASVIMGFFTSIIDMLATSVLYPENAAMEGGGPIESLIRLLKQMNLTLELDMGYATIVIKTIDKAIMIVMWAMAQILPDFSRFDSVRYVAEGYNIPVDVWGQQIVVGLAYALVATCLGYFFLRTREIAA